MTNYYNNKIFPKYQKNLFQGMQNSIFILTIILALSAGLQGMILNNLPNQRGVSFKNLLHDFNCFKQFGFDFFLIDVSEFNVVMPDAV